MTFLGFEIIRYENVEAEKENCEEIYILIVRKKTFPSLIVENKEQGIEIRLRKKVPQIESWKPRKTKKTILNEQKTKPESAVVRVRLGLWQAAETLHFSLKTVRSTSDEDGGPLRLAFGGGDGLKVHQKNLDILALGTRTRVPEAKR